jgi:L-asparaginase II
LILTADSYVRLAEYSRSGLVEGAHHGAVVVLSSIGDVEYAAGDVGAPMYPRSANKPMQAAGLVELGLDVSASWLALVGASHSGEPFHVEGVTSLLASAGLTPDDLQNTPHLPLHEASARAAIRRGEVESSLAADCSGKHAGMLVTCVVNRWSTHDYLTAQHPLQVHLRDTLARLAGEPVRHDGVDGCGAPLWSLSLVGLARSFAAGTTADAATPQRRIADAMRAYPLNVGGTDRDVTRFMESVPGLLAKEGAEGVYAAALPDGRAVALKIAGGSYPAAQVVLAAALVRAGVDASLVEPLATVPVLGHGEAVGELSATLP